MGNFHDIANTLMPFAGMLVPFIFVITIVAMKNAQKMRRERMRYEVIRLAIEKGQPIPTELAASSLQEKPENSPEERALNDKRAGLICIAVGIGLFLLLRNMTATRFERLEWAGAIPAFVGVALIVSGFLGRSKNAGRADGQVTPDTLRDPARLPGETQNR